MGENRDRLGSGRSVIDKIFTIWEIQAKSRALYAVFVDFQQAYDRIKSDTLHRAMAELEVKRKLWKAIKLP